MAAAGWACAGWACAGWAGGPWPRCLSNRLNDGNDGLGRSEVLQAPATCAFGQESGKFGGFVFLDWVEAISLRSPMRSLAIVDTVAAPARTSQLVSKSVTCEMQVGSSSSKIATGKLAPDGNTCLKNIARNSFVYVHFPKAWRRMFPLDSWELLYRVMYRVFTESVHRVLHRAQSQHESHCAESSHKSQCPESLQRESLHRVSMRVMRVS